MVSAAIKLINPNHTDNHRYREHVFLNIRNSKIGSFHLNCRTINIYKEIIPIISEPTTILLIHPVFPALLNPYKIPSIVNRLICFLFSVYYKGITSVSLLLFLIILF